jgi:hypothetical protein
MVQPHWTINEAAMAMRQTFRYRRTVVRDPSSLFTR